LLREWFERLERRPSFAQTRPVAPPVPNK
jgi:hypothetical protein